jgi:predicted DNA-binding protein
MADKTKTKIKRAAWGTCGESKMVTIRMPLELIEKLNAASKRLGLSKNQIICSACLETIEKLDDMAETMNVSKTQVLIEAIDGKAEG